MIRNQDSIDETLTKQIATNPGITMSELRQHLIINVSTLRYRLISLELAGIIAARRSRNATAYYIKAGSPAAEKVDKHSKRGERTPDKQLAREEPAQ